MSKRSECPNCQKLGKDRSKDNLIHFSNGNYCFACGYREITDPLYKLRPKKERVVNLFIPPDLQKELPEKCHIWLDSFDLTDEEKEKFQWSEMAQRLFYIVRGANNEVIMLSGRTFSQGKKYLSFGTPADTYDFIGNQQDSIVVCEDIVSALKIGRISCAMPLWCASLPMQRIIFLSQRFKHLYIWLDRDKFEEALKIKRLASNFFDSVKVVVSTLDPKCYSSTEIQEILNAVSKQRNSPDWM